MNMKILKFSALCLLVFPLSLHADSEKKKSFCDQAKNLKEDQDVKRHLLWQVNLLEKQCYASEGLFENWKMQHTANQMQLAQMKMTEMKQTNDFKAASKDAELTDLTKMTSDATTSNVKLTVLRDKTLSDADRMKHEMAERYDKVTGVRVNCEHVGYNGKEALQECQRAIKSVGKFSETLKKYMRDTGMPHFQNNYVAQAERDVIQNFGAKGSTANTVNQIKYAKALEEHSKELKAMLNDDRELADNKGPHGEISLGTPNRVDDGGSLSPSEGNPEERSERAERSLNEDPESERERTNEKWGFMKDLFGDRKEEQMGPPTREEMEKAQKENGTGATTLGEAESKTQAALLEEVRMERSNAVAAAMSKPASQRTEEEKEMIKEWNQEFSYADAGTTTSDAGSGPKALSSTERRMLSQKLMNNCVQRTGDPRACMGQVNKEMEKYSYFDTARRDSQQEQQRIREEQRNPTRTPAQTNNGLIQCVLTDSRGTILSRAMMNPEDCAAINPNYKLKR